MQETVKKDESKIKVAESQAVFTVPVPLKCILHVRAMHCKVMFLAASNRKYTVVQRAKSIRGCIVKGISRRKELTLPLDLGLVEHL